MLFELVALQSLLIFNLLLRVLIALQNLVMLLFTLLEVLVHLIFETLSERIHLRLLLLHEFGFRGEDLLVAILHVLLALALLQLIRLLLHLVRVLIILLFCKVGLDLALVQKLCRKFECERQRLFHRLTILLQLLRVPDLEFLDFDLVLFLRL